MNISNVTNQITKFAGKVIFKTKIASPKILLGVGVVGTVGAFVLACKASTKTELIVENHIDAVERIKEVHENPSFFDIDYSDRDYKKDLTTQYLHTGWEFIKVYGPSISLLTVSMGMILYSHGIMSKRNMELLAAYKALENSFNNYKQKVRERLGEDEAFNTEFVNKIVSDQPDDNSKKTEVVKLTNEASPYARFFDETNVNWERNDRSLNLFFLERQQAFANDKLHRIGYVFLNEVYEALGIPKTPAGQLVGWYLGGDGDDFIDFGIFDGSNEKKRDFVNGFEPSILLDFNVDGVIYDLI